MLQAFREDYNRMTGEKWGGLRSWTKLLSSYELRYILFLRKRQHISGSTK